MITCPTLDQFVAIRPLLEVPLQTICVLLPLELLLCCLERTSVSEVSNVYIQISPQCLRGSIGVEEDMSVLEVLRIRSMLEVLFE